MSENQPSEATGKADLGDSVSMHMRRNFALLKLDETIEQSLTRIRRDPPGGKVIYFYVVDQDNRLQGVVPTRRLLLRPPQTLISSIVINRVISVPISATVHEACEFFVLHRLLAFPVVDENNRIMGIVDIELYTDKLTNLDEKEKDNDLFQLIGVHLDEAKPSTPWAAFRSRFPWLVANIAGGILAALLTGVFEAEIQKVVALALFIPVVLALAESVSIQSVSLSLQSLHGDKPTLRSIFFKLLPESGAGLMLGAACGLAVGLVALIWLGDIRVVLCLLGGIGGGVTCAAVIGVAIPNLLRYCRLDPQVAAGPIALASTDMVTLLAYFTLARWLLN